MLAHFRERFGTVHGLVNNAAGNFLSASEDLTPGKDVLFYHPSPRASLLKPVGGQGAVFFPVDAHRPSMAIDTPVLVRKTVVKVPVE